MPIWLDSIIVLIVVLVIARFVKRGARPLQKYFIPSALIAGFAGLLLSHQVLGYLPANITAEWAKYPKILITIVFAGLFLGRPIPSPRTIIQKAGPMIAFGNTLAWGQYVIGILLTLVVLGPLFHAPALTGALIEIGFEGGHGTAAGLAPTFEMLGWAEATDIALGLATVSIVVAIISGLIIINVYNHKRGRVFDKAAMHEQQQRMIRGGYSLTRFADEFNSVPREVAINICLFGVAILLGWSLHTMLIWGEDILLANVIDLRFFKYVPLFPFAMIGGLVVQLTLRKLHKTHLIRRSTTKVISSLALDLLIASAIATLSLHTLSAHLPIFLILAVSGIVWILAAFFFFAPRFFRQYWFENGLTNTGQSMGMTATGLLMNRLVDPNNHSRAREAFAYKQLAFEPFMGGGLVTAAIPIVLVEFGQIPVLVGVSLIFCFWIVVGLKLGRTHRHRLRRSDRSSARLAALVLRGRK